MDCRQPLALQPRQTALSERPDRCGMPSYRAADPAGQARRRQTARRYPRGDHRRDVHSEHRLPGVRDAQGCAAPEAPCMITSALWNWDGTLDRIHHALQHQVPRESRARSQPHGLHHRQSECAPRAEKGALASTACGFHAGKLIKGKKPHVPVDTQGLLLARHRDRPPAVQDRGGSLALLATLFGLFPSSGKLFADSAYQGPVFHRTLAAILPDLETEIVKRSDRPKSFVVQPRRCGRRTHHRLAQPLPPTGQVLREPQPPRARLHQGARPIRLMLRELCNPT